MKTAAPDHRVARHWLDGALSGSSPVGLTWFGLMGFIRLTTHPTILPNPLAPETAMDVVNGWLGARSARVLHPGIRHAGILRGLLEGGAHGNASGDAHLAAIAIEHKATIVTFDSDFGRFPDVRWERPK